jgi:hypothetical protein
MENSQLRKENLCPPIPPPVKVKETDRITEETMIYYTEKSTGLLNLLAYCFSFNPLYVFFSPLYTNACLFFILFFFYWDIKMPALTVTLLDSHMPLKEEDNILIVLAKKKIKKLKNKGKNSQIFFFPK